MIGLSVAVVVLFLGAAAVSNAYAIGSLNRRIRLLERAKTPEPACAEPVSAGAYRTAPSGCPSDGAPFSKCKGCDLCIQPHGDGSCPSDTEPTETPPAVLARWRNLAIRPSDVRLGGCTAHFEYTTDDTSEWCSSTVYSSAFDEASIRSAVEKHLRSIVETQKTAAALQNGVVR